MVYDDLMIRNNTVSYYNTNRLRPVTRWKTKLGISICMEISIIVLLFQAVWKFQYGFKQIIDHVFLRALAMPSCFVSWIPIGHCFQRDHSLNLDKLALIGFIVWHLWECGYQHSLSTVVKCLIFGRFIVNVQKALFWRKILFSLPINITNNTNFYRLKK